jgi:excisionase family DNA binding protein
MTNLNNKKTAMPSSKEFFSTGEAAEICSVTPDTVLKWIRAGKIPAKRTPGGHNRIPRRALLKFVEFERFRAGGRFSGSRFLYCWEYYSESGTILEGCRECIVYRSRSRRCYEMSSPPANEGHTGLFCKNSCDECEYYILMKDQKPSVLVVTDQSRLKASLERDSRGFDFDLRVADCEYRCSMLVEQFRPDYVIIDCALGTDRSLEFTRLLFEDPRIPCVRIILAGDSGELPGECVGMVFALIDRHFTARTLAELLGSPRTRSSNVS